MADYLTIDHLKQLVGAEKVDQYFDDDLSGSIEAGDETDTVTFVLNAAESLVSSKMKRSYGDAAIIELANADDGFILQAAWLALELACERRPEFCDSEGRGQYWAQQERALKFFDDLSKGKTRSKGESAAGIGDNIGGDIKPQLDTGVPRFTFAPDDDYPTGHGGF